MTIQWPEAMPDGGRVQLSQSKDAFDQGTLRMCDDTRSCQQTLQISLFFDGTNNNDDAANPYPKLRDSVKHAHTNVARLFNVALDKIDEGIFAFYISGVGTPLEEIGEKTYLEMGKAMAKGFSARCVLGYIRLLNAVYYAIAPDKTLPLISREKAKLLCDAAASGDMSGFDEPLQTLGVTHKLAVDGNHPPGTIKKIWINVIGFSRGAAGARAFVHKLVNEWAPGGNLAKKFDGKYALQYQVNFMGLFDTVASVGPPDSTRATVDIGTFDGHYAFASGGAMRIPDSVRYCVHAFSIHEQRMSFPVDSIREVGGSYPGGIRYEIAYPGVHSDVGGGYQPNEQGKGRDSDNGDGGKLSQIPLHDMYIHALKYGVPMVRGDEILSRADFASDFALFPETIAAFNGWLKTAGPIGKVEDAIKHGMKEMLAWRTLRAQPDTDDYVTKQEFFRQATEDSMTPYKVANNIEKAKDADPQLQALNAKMARLQGQKSQATNGREYPANMPRIMELDAQIAATKQDIDRRTEVLCGKVGHPGVEDAKPARPGEGVWDVTTNDRNDLRQGAEEMRLLLGYLHPAERETKWKVTATVRVSHAPRNAFPNDPVTTTTLSVPHDQPGSDTPRVTLAESGILLASTWSTILSQFSPSDDLMAAPARGVVDFLKKHASLDAANQLQKEVIVLLDDYVHDSRIWFRIPWFHEYAPGGYGWPRVIFEGGRKRIAYLGLTSESEMLAVGNAQRAAWA
ncbi:T6SS phospholipase effector Tle1-like catalytic domain-containing protein [Burkholderia vietnamiensis]|uniref:T6SS phospholipase effector Tle1-like catalytic domain-containing protein n=1 Tax=Burkholderia vietnamiensis TaxID=60552 RepID=UPI0007596150|nr:DUF2235 domain-containing protein [Burkholderia vietnamiensis]KVE72312.1 hypothetical protein WI98_22120 [Burkholderia vietnamiensis]